MAKKVDKNLIVALDVGTSKIAALVGEVNNNEIALIGYGVVPSRGLKRGVVVNIETTTQSIYQAVKNAEVMTGYPIQFAFTGIAGSHIRSINSRGIVAIRDGEVKQSDVDRVIEAAKAVAIPADQQILHILPQEFIIDQQEGVRDPIGMSGVRLEAEVHMISGAVSAAQNINKCVRRCGLKVNDIILEQLASSNAVLSEDEKELGVCLIDIGAGTTDIAVFTHGAIRHTAVIPIAGDHVTNDIAVALRIPTVHAEEIKINSGAANTKQIDMHANIEVPGIAKRPSKTFSKRALAEVIGSRYEELFSLVKADIQRHGLESLITAGIVLTGGASKLSGVVEVAESVFGMPVRLGVPQNVQGLIEITENPIYATSVGLLLYGLQWQTNRLPSLNQQTANVWSRMKRWFVGNF